MKVSNQFLFREKSYEDSYSQVGLTLIGKYVKKSEADQVVLFLSLKVMKILEGD